MGGPDSSAGLSEDRPRSTVRKTQLADQAWILRQWHRAGKLSRSLLYLAVASGGRRPEDLTPQLPYANCECIHYLIRGLRSVSTFAAMPLRTPKPGG